MVLNKHYLYTSAFLALSCLFTNMLMAQTMGNVYSPVITPEQQALEYRTAFVPNSGGSPDRFANRVHYQNPLGESLRWRVLLQGSNRQANGMDFDWVQAELLWQFKHNNSDGWDSALRFDARISDNNLPDRIGFNWSGQWTFLDRWQARTLILSAREFGDHARGGVLLETRARVSYRLQSGNTAALEMFNAYGRSSNTGSFKTQRHRIGPMFSGKLGKGFAFNLGVLWGLSDAADNIDIRAALIKNF